MNCLIFQDRPPDFVPYVEVASCYCMWNQHVLLLQRHPRKSHGGTWGVPAGKLEKDETPREAIKRELLEEIGVIVEESQFHFLATLYVRHGIDFPYHMFYVLFETLPLITLGLDEHQAYQWKSFQDAIHMPLMPGEHETLDFVRKAFITRQLL
jgi:8-oxo-dGTP pyrophosphatase MutT (NUDIX family)